MMGPIRWFKWNIASFVQRTVSSSLSAENLSLIRDDMSTISNEILQFKREIFGDQRIPIIEHTLTHVVSRLDAIDAQTQDVNAMVKDVGARLDKEKLELQQLRNRIRANPYQKFPVEFQSSHDGSSTMGFDGTSPGTYFDFVETFRPTFKELIDQLAYLATWLPTTGTSVDLGAGRGELVQLMRNHGLSSFGIDSDQSMVTAAGEKGLDVRLSDIDTFIKNCATSSFDVVTAIQVIEHVDTSQLESWLSQIRKILKSGGVFIAETPNPHAIDAFKAFWVDVTHIRPYYPEALLHLAQSAGFSRAEIWAPGHGNNISERLEFAGSYTLIARA